MTGLYGADPEAMRRLAEFIDRRRRALQSLTRVVDLGVADSARYWSGNDAAVFRDRWRSDHTPHLARCLADLGWLSRSIEANADAQEQTSRADLAGPSGSTGSFPPAADDRGVSGLDRLGQWAGDQWDRAAGELMERWDDTVDRVVDEAGDLGEAAADRLLADVRTLNGDLKMAFNLGAPGAVLGAMILGLPGALLGAHTFRESAAPRINHWWNHDATPWLVRELFEQLDDGGGPAGSGDREARVPGGPFPVRVSGRPDGPEAFTVDGDDNATVGRNAVIRALEDTADGQQIQADEFQIVAHDNGSYTLVLPGVTDLTNPNAGLSEHHRSVRDTDWAAARSAAGASVDDNEYAKMVRAYLIENVPPGADLAIVGHSFGADTALDLATDPVVNGRQYQVTHVVAAAYHSEPQLVHVPEGTEVMVLQNTRDIPVLVEELGHASSPAELAGPTGASIIVDEFTGGWTGAGHHQHNYTERVRTTTNQAHEAFFTGWAQAGYGRNGEVTAVDVSVHDDDQGK